MFYFILMQYKKGMSQPLLCTENGEVFNYAICYFHYQRKHSK